MVNGATPRVKSVRIPAAYWAGQKDAVELNVVGKGQGRVLWFSGGQGHIKADDGEEFFVHFTGIPGQGDRSLSPAEVVEFDIVESPQGQHAVRVRHKSAKVLAQLFDRRTSGRSWG